MNMSRRIAAVVMATLGSLAAGAAQAREPQLQWSLTIGSPLFTQAVPYHARPGPGYVYAQPRAVLVPPAPLYRQRAYRQPTRWDRDGDGIPNRRDRLHNPAWDRDGDGIPNRRDRFDDRRHDGDRDGVPYRTDRRDGPGWRGR